MSKQYDLPFGWAVSSADLGECVCFTEELNSQENTKEG